MNLQSTDIQKIPFHNFTRDDRESVEFQLVTLEKITEYDFLVPHRHNYYEVFIFIKGGGNHVIDFEAFDVKDKSIHFVSPGQVHLLKRSYDSEGFLILFSRDFFYSGHTNKPLLQHHPLLNNRSSQPIINAPSSEFEKIIPLILKIKEELTREDDYQRELLRLYLNEFLYRSLRMLTLQKENPHTLVSGFLALLEQNFYEWHLVKQYASELHVAEKYLSESLKLHTGLTAQDHISNRLLLEAKRLLRFSELSIKEVAFQIGFEDPSHFTKFFRSTSGSTPSSFRELA